MNQSCINVNLIPNFKFLAEHYKVSQDTLKEIIYKYRIETNNEDAVPTGVYIQAQTGNMQYVDAAPSAKKLWEAHYKTPKEYSSDSGFQEAKQEALGYFPAKAIVVYTNHKGHKVLAVKEPVSKIEPKHRKDFKSWQDYNDYLLTMGDLIPEESKDREERIVGPQPFTFKDGTTITVPFRPNSQQEEALNVMNDFINSKETTMTLSGYAGTGKTSLMEIIANKAKKERKHIVFSASTNKAAAVLRDRVKSAGFTAQTLNKVFGIQVEVDQGKPYDANNLVNKLKEADIIPGTIVVIDEASMINEENYKILNGIAKENGLKIIYVGDKGQLAPVKETQVSKVFRNQNGRIINLTKVERTDDNAILKEATNIRNGEPLSGESSFNEEGKGVAYVKKSNKEAIRNIVERFVPYLKNNPDYFRILAFHNNAVANYNDAVRKALGYNDNTPRVNEPIVGYNNWGYVWDKKGGYYKFINSEAYKVAKVGEPAQRRWTVDGTNIIMQATPVVLEDAMGNTQTIDFMDIKGNAENRKNALVLAKRKTKLFNDAMKMSKLSPVRADMLREVNAIEEFLFVNDNIEDPDVVNGQGKHPTLQKKVFDFGYAMTVHKSQGSTFTHVMMDDADIATARNTQSSWNTVNIGNDLGEAFDEAPMEVQESGNIFDLINQPSQPTTLVTSPTPSTDNNNVNVRQQLEYVAVSRATDTVTIIANDANVKKEDTPLNHVKVQAPQKPIDKRFQFRSKPFENEIKGGDFIIGKVDREKVYARVHDNGRDGRPYAHTEIGGYQETYNLDSNGNIQYAFPENMVAPLDIENVYPSKREALLNLQDILRKMEKAKKGIIIYEDGTTSEDTSAVPQPVAIENTPKPADQMNRRELWEHLGSLAEPMGERPVSYTPKGKTRQEYIVKDGKVYNKKGEEVQYKGKDLNRIFANLAITEGRGVVVTYRNNNYVVDNHQNITSVASGDIMKWGPENGDRKAIIQLAEEKFKILIENRQQTQEIISVDDMRSTLKNNAKDTSTTILIDCVFDALKNSNIKFQAKDLGEGISGRYVASDNTILYNPSALQNNTFLHEAIHAATSYYLEANNIQGFSNEVKIAINEIKECYDLLKQDFIDEWKKKGSDITDKNFNFWIEGDDTYGYTSPKEMVAELGKPSFVEHIRDFDKRHKGQNIFKRLKDAIMSLFGINKTYGSLESTLKKALWTLLTNPNKELMDRYTLENANVKKNHKALRESKHVVVENGRAIEEMIKNLSEDTSEGFVDTVLEMDEDAVPYSFNSPEKIERLSSLRQGTVFIYKNQLFMSLNGTPHVDNGRAIIPVRVYSRKDLTLNNFDIKRDTNGLDYIADTTPLFPELQIAQIQQTQQSEVSFTESTGGYPQRTKENADWSDITLALATNFNTAGEKLTKRVAGNKYVGYELVGEGEHAYDADEILAKIEEANLPTKNVKLNIAGNGIYSLKDWTQEQLNDYVTSIISGLQELGVTISEIRSGGQTGIDEAGIIAAQRLGIPASVHAPKGFLFRTAEGKDIADRNAFESRFNRVPQPVQQVQQQNVPASYEGMITPDANTIFVFGSNPKGIHGAGAAAIAKAKFGAIQGQGEGIQGNAYALPTKDLDKAKGTRWYRPGSEEEAEVKEWYKTHDYSEVQNHPLNAERTIAPQQIIESIKKLYEVANQNPDKQFKVSYYPFGQLSLNGYLGEEMLAMFKQAGQVPSNVVFNKEWTDHWNEVSTTNVENVAQQSFIPHPIQMTNLGKETGERLIQVDAEWKSPILLDLDYQLGQTESESEKNNIMQQMQRVKDATSEEDYQKAPTAERQEVNDKMTDYWRRNNQMNALMDNEVNLSASEVREIAEQVVNSISDIITEIQADPEKVKEYFPTLSIKKDLKTATRKEVVQAVNINNLISEAKRRFENIRYDESNQEAYNLYNDSFELMDQADLILDNWETVMELAADVFVVNEGFSIKRDTKKQSFETEEREFTGYDYDNYTDPQDEDSIREQEDEQEHWQVEARTIDAFNSMSDQVRLAYHNCYELDRDGNKVLDKWGIPKRVNKVRAVAQTLRWTQGALDIHEMIEKLNQKEAKNPWLSQLTRRLIDDKGNEADFQSQFYGVMHRHFQLYSIGQLEKGVYASKTLNSHVALSEVMKSITAQFQLKGHPLFDADGTVKPDSLKQLKNWHKELGALINKYNIKFSNGKYTSNDAISDADVEVATKNVSAISRMLGYSVSEESVKNIIAEDSLHKMWSKLGFAIDNLDKAGKDYDPFNFEADNNIRSEVMGFLTPIVEELEDAATNAFFDNGKMYQSYVIPSFLTQLFDQFKQSPDKVYQWMEEFYGQSEWFKDKDGNWRLEWLDLMSRDPKARETFDHKVQLNFNKHDYMRNMSPEEFTLSVFMEYFTERLNMKDLEHTPAWFRVPIQSNKPSSEFIKFYTDRSPAYKDNIVSKVYGMFLQELSRIDTVRKRNKKEGDREFIASFDENGRKFQFLPFLNSYLEDNSSELGKLLQKKLKAEVESKLSEAEEGRLMTLVQEATRNFMQQRADSILQTWEDTGILKAAEKIKGIKSLNHSVRENLENFLWNDFFAANSILQLTIVDKAFYPNATELQKRLAELHAPGTRGNKYATDYKGKSVSDGFYRTLLIKDLDGFTASIIENIDAIFKRKIEAAPENEKPAWEALRESLVGENGAYRRINVTDGQAYSSPSSYRKKAFMFGKWSKKAENIYQRLLKGDFSISDLEVAFQPLKPFVYGHLSKDMEVDKAPITKMPVPFQAKNSEYLLIMADALMRGQGTGRPNLLKAIFDIMEESHYDAGHYGEEDHYRRDGIDTVQFDSAIKSGNQAVVDITPFLNIPGGEAGAYTLMKNAIFQENVAEDGSKYNYTYVHKTDYDNYALQQEVPAHFKEHQQAEGSQQRMNIPTDLDFYDYNGEVNNYSWKDPDGTEHKMNAKEFRHEYERVHAANIEDSFNTLAKELHLNSNDKKARNLALSEILQEEIISSPRYGLDLFLACQIDPATGEFRIPKGDPIQGKRIEQLINSIIKNRVNKQKIAGGPIVQVTNFGTSKQLHIRFHDKNGGILMTKEEYEKSIQDQPTSQTDKFNAKYGKKTGSTGKSYEEYVKENQAGVAYFEIFAPIGMQKLFEKFKNADGTINLEAVEKCDPELLKVITGRIPNEDKYSIAHGKIVGFMPALAGDGIMFPYELTEIDDSDFDVDKRYTMRKVMDIIEDTDKIRKSLYNRVVKSYRDAHNGEISYSKKKELNDAVNMLLDNPGRMENTDALMASLYQEYQKILREEYPYKTRYPKKGTRDANNNRIIDMSWAVMSNEMTADKILNPGGFEIPKHTAYVIAAYRNSDGTKSWQKLESMTTKQLQKLASKERDLAWFDDHIQFYKQNAAGSNLIGVFAVNKVAHATLEGDGLLINIEDFCGEKPFTICDTEFKKMMSVDGAKDSNGQRIGKNIGSGIGASADTAKDPWLDSININMTTAGMYNMLLRIGMPMADAELFMAQDVISRMLGEFNRKSLENKGTTLDKIIQEKIDTIKGKYKYTEDSEINTQPLTREELKKGLLAIRGNVTQERDAIEYKTLLAFQRLKTLAKAIRKPTLITRLNSISSAVGPLIIDNIILEHKLNEFLQVEDEDSTGFYTKNPDGTYSPVDMDDILANHPILKQFSRPIDSRNPDCPTRILFSDMPTGSSLFKSVLKALPSNIDAKIYDDRQLLNKLSDFFQSYLLVANNVVKPEKLKYYIEEFPKEFSGVGKSSSIKEQHPDNAFVQAIQLNYEKKSNKAFLNINTTGMKEQEKERLRMAWTDLHKVDPELSTKLFTYAFFRGGIGFSPKTFMGLVPTYVKEHLTDYVDTYRHFPKVLEDVVIEQFVRNNWDNSTLVPRKGGENTKYEIDLDNGTLIVRDENDKKDLTGIKFMKTGQDKETYLWKLLGTEDTNKRERYYVRIYPLGNNGEYVEMSTVKDMKAMSKTTELIDNTEIQELPETSPSETDAAEVDTPTQVPESDSQQSKTLADLAPAVMRRDSRQSPESAMKHLERYKAKALSNTLQKREKAYLVNLFSDLGLKLTPEEAVAKFKEFC